LIICISGRTKYRIIKPVGEFLIGQAGTEPEEHIAVIVARHGAIAG